MEAKKLVTVCMCTRNRAYRMLPSIKCILNQTYTNFELLVIDDNSTDDTVNILKQLEEQDSRIRHISLQTHDFIEARNTAFREAKGEYICLMDSDDMCSPNKLEEQVKFLESHNDIDVVGCKIKFGNKMSHLSIPNTQTEFNADFFKSKIDNNENISMLIHFPAIMIRKTVLDDVFPNHKYFYDELCNGGEDQIFLYLLYIHNKRFSNVITCTYMYNYLEYNDAISATIGQHFNENNFIFKYIHNKTLQEKLTIINELYIKYSK